MNRRFFLCASILFNIIALYVILHQEYWPNRSHRSSTDDTCTVGIIAPPLTPTIERIQEVIKEHLSNRRYKLTTYSGTPGEMPTTVNQALKDGAQLLISIGRHASLAAYEATKKGKIPLVFCEVLDPVIEHLVDTPQISGNHVTGVVRTPADYPAFIDALDVIKPTPKKITLLHNASEYSEEKEVDDFIDACKVKAVEVTSVALKQDSHSMKKINEVIAQNKPDALMVLAQGFSDAIMHELADECKKKHILLFCNSVKYAYHAAAIGFGIDDYDVGKAVGHLVETIIHRGIHPTKIPLRLLDDAFSFTVNTRILKEQGASILPDALFIMKYGHVVRNTC